VGSVAEIPTRGSTALLVGIWAFFRLPETKGRSFEELDMLFNNGVPARKFKRYEVDAYNEQLVHETVARRQSSVVRISWGNIHGLYFVIRLLDSIPA
jgi:hypothetical protein